MVFDRGKADGIGGRSGIESLEAIIEELSLSKPLLRLVGVRVIPPPCGPSSI